MHQYPGILIRNHLGLFYVLTIIFFLAGCSSYTEDPDKKLIGIWSMEKVYENDVDVTAKHNPNKNRWIEFEKDGTFISGGDPFGENTGRWKMDNKNSVLSIESNVDDDNSQWNVSFKDDLTIWTGIGHPRKEGTKLVHKRKNR